MEVRIGKFTLLELQYCPCPNNCKKTACANFKLMFFNIGFEIKNLKNNERKRTKRRHKF